MGRQFSKKSSGYRKTIDTRYGSVDKTVSKVFVDISYSSGTIHAVANN